MPYHRHRTVPLPSPYDDEDRRGWGFEKYAGDEQPEANKMEWGGQGAAGEEDGHIAHEQSSGQASGWPAHEHNRLESARIGSLPAIPALILRPTLLKPDL